MRRRDDDEATLGFSQYLAVLLRQRRIVAGGAVGGLVVAAVFLLVAPQTVTATTSLNVNVITTEPFNQQRPASGLLDPQTEADIASSHVVAQGASELLGGALSPAEVRDASEVTAPGGASVVKVAFTGGTQDEAVRGADAVAKAYLAFRSGEAERRIDTMLSSMNDQIEGLNDDLLDANEALVSADPDSTAYAQALSQQQQIQSELDSLLSQRNALTNVDTTGGTILTSARDGRLETHPSRRAALGTGLAGGLVAGIVAAFAWNPFDRRLRRPSDVAAAAGAPRLASLAPRGSAPLPDAEVREEMRVVRERLLGAVGAGPVLLFDARRAEGPSRAGEALADVAGDALELETVAADGSRADGLAALRRARGVVLLCRRRAARTADVAWIREEAERAGVPLVGYIEDA